MDGTCNSVGIGKAFITSDAAVFHVDRAPGMVSYMTPIFDLVGNVL